MHQWCPLYRDSTVSKYSFTKGQPNLLNKNLNFCPTLIYYYKEAQKRDIKNFTGKIRLRGHFYDNNENQEAEEIIIHQHSVSVFRSGLSDSQGKISSF